jgi:hypothetical protein
MLGISAVREAFGQMRVQDCFRIERFTHARFGIDAVQLVRVSRKAAFQGGRSPKLVGSSSSMPSKATWVIASLKSFPCA